MKKIFNKTLLMLGCMVAFFLMSFQMSAQKAELLKPEVAAYAIEKIAYEKEIELEGYVEGTVNYMQAEKELTFYQAIMVELKSGKTFEDAIRQATGEIREYNDIVGAPPIIKETETILSETRTLMLAEAANY